MSIAITSNLKEAIGIINEVLFQLKRTSVLLDVAVIAVGLLTLWGIAMYLGSAPLLARLLILILVNLASFYIYFCFRTSNK